MSAEPQRGNRTLIGIQAAALGWDDPFTPGLSSRWWRTGEGQGFSPQDPPPTPEALGEYLRGLGLDFYLHPVIPSADNYRAAFEFARSQGVRLLVGNEIGTINGEVTDGTNRYDPDESLLAPLARDGRLAGVVYDESEHLQIHPDQYAKHYDPGAIHFQWGVPTAGGLSPEAVTRVARRPVAAYAPAPALHEFVFPTLVHALARAGFVPAPKILKESCAPVHLAVAMGAATQYGRPLAICVDLWGPDVGPWFTRLWGSPGHSPAEFASALRLAGSLGPACLYVENMDSLCRSEGSRLVDTEFGDLFREWRLLPPADKQVVGELSPAVAVVHADRGDVALGHANPLSPGRETGRTFFEAMHVLTHGHALVNASTLHFSGANVPAGRYPRTPDRLAGLPYEHGEPDPVERVHRLFAPMNSVAVFDEHVDDMQLTSARAIVVVGDTVPAQTLDMVAERSRAGVDCVVTRATMPAAYRVRESSHLIVVDSVLDSRALQMLQKHLGPPDLYRVEFERRSVEIRPGAGPDDLEMAVFDA